MNPILCVDGDTYKDLKRINSEFTQEYIEDKSYRQYIKPFQEPSAEDLKCLFSPTIELREINQQKIDDNIENNIKKFEYEPKNFNKYVFLKDIKEGD